MVSWMDHGIFSATGEPFGIGNGIRKSLERFKAGFLPTEAGGRSTFENGNGALMRILPLAFYLYDCRNAKKRKKIIYDCCSITHYHELSKITCHFYVEFLICLLKTRDFQKSYNETARRFRKTTNRKEFERLFSNELFLLRKSEINSGSYRRAVQISYDGFKSPGSQDQRCRSEKHLLKRLCKTEKIYFLFCY